MSALGFLLLGAGGHAREVAASIDRSSAAADRSGTDFVGFLADWVPEGTRKVAENLPLLGGIDDLAKYDLPYLIAVGSPPARRDIANRTRASSGQLACIIDPTAVIGPRVELGRGLYIGASAIVTVDVRLADHVHLNVRSSIHHDTTIGAYTTVGPGAVLCGAVSVGEAVEIGAGAILLPGVAVGDEVVIGAGAVVTKDVAAGTVVAGVPARSILSAQGS